MGNTSTKEQRAGARRPRHLDPNRLSSPTSSGPNSPLTDPPGESSSRAFYNSRTGRGSRPDLSALLGLANHAAEEGPSVESRRETKQEKDARKLEKDRIVRTKERERSMKEEHVDGGYLVTQGVYTGIEDFDKPSVRQLMIERRLAPFWRGLSDFNYSWTENQLIAAARGLPIPAPDEIPKHEDTGPFAGADQESEPKIKAPACDKMLMVPITSRSRSYGSDSSNLPHADPTTSSSIFRGRAKTLASLTTSSKSSETITPAEIQLPRDPYINGQRIEVFLYRDTFECSICFLYYPRFGNKTRCCDQWICSECFVQIKRPDPHPPEHTDPSAPPPPSPTAAEEAGEEPELVSEPATCPFCKESEFGITYESPPFRRGLSYVNQPSNQQLSRATSAMSSSSSLSSGPSGGQLSPESITRKRTTSLSAANPSVVTTDNVRPEWYHKLMTARANASRRSAAATALHTAAYMMGDRGFEEVRGLSSFGRRGILRRSSGPEFPTGGHSSAHASMMALLSERHAAGTPNRLEGHEWNATGSSMAPPRASSRRDRMEEIDHLMMLEGIRASLATEEERHRQEDKVAKKEAKKAKKEAKKKEKAARKTEKARLYSNSANASGSGLSTRSETSLGAGEPSSSAAGKGKATLNTATESSRKTEPSLLSRRLPQRSESDAGVQPHPFVWDSQAGAQSHLERARAQLNPELSPSSLPFGSSTYKPSHLRTTSTVSSSASSINESLPGSGRNAFQGSSSSLEASPSTSGENLGQASSSSEAFISGTPPGGGAGTEPMFNFRSLAAMVGKDDGVDPMDTNSDDQESSVQDPLGVDVAPTVDRATRDERSDSMATERPKTEFYETAEYPHEDSGGKPSEYDRKIAPEEGEGVHKGDGQAVT
ncbi:MAG: hypothetical protein LQ349_006117 [Xanthoria aureola]|nr:MAG: hypothetical protein LQ349_006117 [Xanthoria aureola]